MGISFSGSVQDFVCFVGILAAGGLVLRWAYHRSRWLFYGLIISAAIKLLSSGVG
jgi:hypothetical protein